MENSILYNTNSIKFIKILFRIILAFFVVVLVVVATVHVDDSVYFDEGLVYSKNPKIKITAPTEAIIESINVSEGQKVAKGDTLLVLRNKKISSNFNISNQQVSASKKKIVILEKLIFEGKQKKVLYKNQIEIEKKVYNNTRASIKKETENLKNKMAFSKQNSMLVKSRYKADSILYGKGVISRLAFEKQKQVFLNDSKKTSEAQFKYKNKFHEFDNLYQKKKENINYIEGKILEINKQIHEYELKIAELNSTLNNTRFQLDYIAEQKDRLIILAPISGTIPYLFNTKYNQKKIQENTLLIVVAPEKESYYVKINLPEKSLIYVKKGQQVNLKIDAYNYYKYGGIRGTVNYVSPSAIKGAFYCIVDVRDNNPNVKLKAEYRLKGNIIVENLKIYKFFIKQLFSKI